MAVHGWDYDTPVIRAKLTLYRLDNRRRLTAESTLPCGMMGAGAALRGSDWPLELPEEADMLWQADADVAAAVGSVPGGGGTTNRSCDPALEATSRHVSGSDRQSASSRDTNMPASNVSM
jgi:hypothetical protein